MAKHIMIINLIHPPTWLEQLTLLFIRKTVEREVVVDEPNYQQVNITEYKLHKGRRYNEHSYGVTHIGPFSYTFQSEQPVKNVNSGIGDSK